MRKLSVLVLAALVPLFAGAAGALNAGSAPTGSRPIVSNDTPLATGPAGAGGEGRGRPSEPPGQAKKNPVEPEPVAAKPTIALLDTGARATHQEFVYEGPASATDQFVAWWDFTSETKETIDLPLPGQTWDDQVPDPYDNHGHGTATAAMAASTNLDPAKTPSAAPGFPLAIAKVGNGDGAIEGDLATAIRWAGFTVDADVINISIGSIVPFPAGLSGADYAAIDEVRAAGKLVVVANGNGFGNAGVPGDPGWAGSYGASTNVLTVGADGLNSFTAHTDPEVAAVYSVRVPGPASDTAYRNTSGTSFSSPFVAGVAARLLDAARSNGHDVAPDYLESVIKFTARDRAEVPPTFEGYGVVDLATLDAALPYATTATLPADPGGPAATHGAAIEGLRDVWSNELRWIGDANIVPIAGGGTPGVIGPSAPTAISDAELMRVDAPAGQQVVVTLEFDDAAGDDIDLFVFQGTDGPFTNDRLLAKSTNSGGPEIASFVSPGPVTVIAVGWLVAADLPVTFTSTAGIEFVSDGYVAHTTGLGIS